MTVRVATPDDIPVVVDLIREFYHETHPQFPFDEGLTRSWVRENLADEERFIRILNDRDGIFLGGITASLFTQALMAQEIIWYTRKSARGHGLKLFRSFEAWANERGVEEVSLSLASDNKVVERLGYYFANVCYLKKLR